LFPDKEKRIRINTKVLGEDCVIVQSTSTPADENYMELFFIIDALKRSGAKSVKAIIPYLGYQRQDHIFRQGEGVSLEVIADLLQKVGMSELFSFDLHTPKITDIFTIPVHHLSALPDFSEKIKSDFKREDMVLVSPDMGGIRRIKEISEMLENIPLATITKNRNLNTGEINDSFLDGYVRGKIAIIVDDMVSTGETLVDASQLLLEEGATKVFAFITHAVLAAGASEKLQASSIERVFVSDTISIPRHKEFAKLSILSVAKTAAKALRD
jgi:ribose-phosphate pyrophosphokinase